MDGSNNPRGEFWLGKEERPYFVPYYQRHDSSGFERTAFNDVLSEAQQQSSS